MKMVRYLIVFFFLVGVPIAAAVDALAPQILDAALGRKVGRPLKRTATWAGESPLELRLTPPVGPSAIPAEVSRAKFQRGPWPVHKDSQVIAAAANIPVPDFSPPTENGANSSMPETKASNGNVYSPPAAQSSDSHILAIQERLSQLGATYMRLEKLGPAEPGFRFLCRMQCGNDATAAMPFEASSGDPINAMQRVLADVLAWQASEITRLQR